jgi:hypothetical protein
MHKAISRALWGAFFVGGLTVLGAGAAHAADTSGEDSIASGNQVGILGELPVTISGNAVSILGDSESSGGAAAVTGGSGSSAGSSTTSGEGAIVGGNQVMPDVVAPIVVGGNSISVVGDSSVTGEHASVPGKANDDAAATTTGADAIVSGNQMVPNVTAPMAIGGNDISVIDIIGDPILELPLIGDLLAINPVAEGMLPSEPGISESLIREPAIVGPLVGEADADVLTPVSSDPAVGGSTTPAEGTVGGLMPMMATAALSPAMMLAATGVEALPLIGGIAIMLATGLALVGLKRIASAIS